MWIKILIDIPQTNQTQPFHQNFQKTTNLATGHIQVQQTKTTIKPKKN